MPTPTLHSQAVTSISEINTDALLLPVFSKDEGYQLSPLGNAINDATADLITKELDYNSHLKWTVGETRIVNLTQVDGTPLKYAVLCGIGDASKADMMSIRRGLAAGFKNAKQQGIKSLSGFIEMVDGCDLTAHQLGQSLSEAAVLSTYTFTKHNTKPSDLPELTIELGCFNTCHDGAKSGLETGLILAEATNIARDFVFDSANYITPNTLKDFAVNELGKAGNQTVNVLNLDDIQAKGMGAFYSVAKGSDEDAYLVHAQYTPKKIKAIKKVALVGKGITFDSGGLSLKPSKNMELMKLDMAGSAAVLGAMYGLRKLQEAGIEVPIQVDGYVGLCENMPSGRASKPGDIVTTLANKTVEINNTDAEGRLVLIDVLTHAQQTSDPDEIIDLATLTGAAIVALGHAAAAIVNREKDNTFREAIMATGKTEGELFWPLPMLDDFKESLKSDVADLINAGSKGQAGTASAGLFLSEFVDEHRTWAHLDIAGPAYTSSDKPEVPKGATGFGVRTLLSYLLSHCK